MSVRDKSESGVNNHTHLLGKGVLSWTRNERISDRYGAVFLDTEGVGEGETVDASIEGEEVEEYEGMEGVLYAQVIEGRESGHVGDFARGLAQAEVPEEDDICILGSGVLFRETGEYGTSPEYPDPIGVRPMDEDKKTFWLTPEALYNLHDSVVRMYFDPYSVQSD